MEVLPIMHILTEFKWAGEEVRMGCARHCWAEVPRVKEWPWWLSSRKEVVGSEPFPPTEMLLSC